MNALQALLNATVIGWFTYSAWKHRHEAVWQLGTLALLGYAYYLIVPDWLRNFTVVS